MRLSPRARIILGMTVGMVVFLVAFGLYLDSPLPKVDLHGKTAPTGNQNSESSTQLPAVPKLSPQVEDSPKFTNQLSEAPLNIYQLWSLVEITIKGPHLSVVNDQTNPFKIVLDVQFVSPSGEVYIVPGFYQGDGQGGMTGNIWLVRFTPDITGNWSFSSRSSHTLLDGHAGTFQVVAHPACETYQAGGLPNFECLGRLSYSGERYLQFVEGTYWLKGGVNEPEDFLAPDVTAGFASKELAVDYLARQGINSIYLLLNNIEGDKQNVWPWLGSNQRDAKRQNEYFDIKKLGEWEQIFDYIQNRGIVLHLVLEDDSAWTGFNRQMYYREMVARFAHYKGLVWNIAEEYNESYSAVNVSRFANLLRDFDPYDHPITVHHSGSTARWKPFLNDRNLDLTSFQTKPEPQNDLANYWFEVVNSAQKTIPISFDETGQLESDQRDLAREIVWSVYLGGANYEIFTRMFTGYPEFELFFADLLRARRFIEQTSFELMSPCNDLLQPEAGYCFGQPGDGYIIYFPKGGSWKVDLSDLTGLAEGIWFSPRTGETLPLGHFEGVNNQTFSTPDSEDWVLWISS